MSMHDMECFVECAVDVVAASGLPLQQKRDMIHTLFCLEKNGDCGFTHCRTTRPMVESQYTFLFDKEEMYDYAHNRAFYDEELPNKAAFSMGDLYIYENYDDEYPEADGKICVDSGFPPWDGMVAAGKITGEGALLVKRLPIHEALLTARQLIEAAHGKMNNYLRDGYLMTLFMSDACEDFTSGMPDSYFSMLLGCTREEFANIDFESWQLPDDGQSEGVPFRRYALTGWPANLMVDDALWTDASYLFYGYRGEGRIALWGKELPLEISVVDDNRSFRVNPYRVDDGPVAWLASADETLKAIADFANLVAARGAPLRDPSADLPVKAHFDAVRLAAELEAQEKALTDPGGSYADKMQVTAQTYEALATVIAGATIPDELIEEDAPFTALLILLHSQAARLVDYAQDPGAPHSELLIKAGGHLLEVTLSELERHSAYIRAHKEGLTAEKKAELAALSAEVSEEGATPERWVHIVNRLWQNPLVDLKGRLTYAGALIQFLEEARKYADQVAGEFRASVLPIPDMASDVSAMEAQLTLLSALPEAVLAEAASNYAHNLGWPSTGRPVCEKALACAHTDTDHRYNTDTALVYSHDGWPGHLAVHVQDGQIRKVKEAL